MKNLFTKTLLLGGIAGSLGIFGDVRGQDTIYNQDNTIDKVIRRIPVIDPKEAGKFITFNPDYTYKFVIKNFKDNKLLSTEEFIYDDLQHTEFIAYKKFENDSMGRKIVKEDKNGDGHLDLIYREDNQNKK